LKEGLANDLVVLAMCSDPEPMDATNDRETKRSVVETNTHTVELAVADRLEVQRWVQWIGFELSEIPMGKRLNLGGQCLKALPETL